MTLNELIAKLNKAIEDGVDGDLPIARNGCGPHAYDIVVSELGGKIFINNIRSADPQAAQHEADLIKRIERRRAGK